MELAELIDERERLSNEKQYLYAIRGLMESEQFKLWLSGFKARNEALIERYDMVDPTNEVDVATIKAQRSVYNHEIQMINDCRNRINLIDKSLQDVNKLIKKKTNHGNDSIMLPREG